MYSCDVCNNYQTYYLDEYEEHVEESHPVCYTCQRRFRTHNGLQQHYLTSYRHNYCGICSRDFMSPAALQGHQETHQPRDIKCPRCERGFPSASAMTKYVELGKCFGLTHSQIVKKVRDWEVRSGNPNLLTVPRIGYTNDNESLGPIQASAAAYNGYAYECYLCQRDFCSLASLNQHLNSGAHYSKEFRCKHCCFSATWLSALIQHFESEKCGFMTRTQVRNMSTPFSQLRLGN